MPEPKQLIETRLRDWFQTAAQQLQTDEARQLLGFAEQVILRAGKRARPRLLFLTYEAYGGTNTEILLDIGIALELHHQFLLIHDDVMDDDLVRYDGPNITGLYLEHGLDTTTASSMAILAGNLLFSYADQLLVDSRLTAETRLALLRLLHHTNQLVQQGQQLDLVSTGTTVHRITEASMRQTSSLKTATYTVHLPMQMAAALLDLPAAERQRIDAFAAAFGILYQWLDDYSDYFPNHSTMDAHPKFRDFRQGKITYPLWHTLQHASAPDKASLERLLGTKTISPAEQKTILELCEQYGSRQAMAAMITTQMDQALERLGDLNMTDNADFRAFMRQYRL